MSKLITIRNTVATAVLAVSVMLTTSVKGDSSQVKALEVKKDGTSASFVLSKMGAFDVQDFLMEDPPRLVLDLIGAKNELPANEISGDGTLVRRVRSSQFASDPTEVTRVVFDLSQDVSYTVTQDEETIVVSMSPKSAVPVSQEETRSVTPMGFGGDAAKPSPEPMDDKVKDEAGAGKAVTDELAADKAATEEAKADGATDEPASPPLKPKSVQSATTPTASAWMKTSSTPSWSTTPSNSARQATMGGADSYQAFAAQSAMAHNKNITIDVQNADMQTVLRSMSEFSSVNIIGGPEVTGPVSAHLKNVPWRQALDVILKSHGFGWREEYGVIRVSTIDKLTKEELELQAAERKRDELLPLVTDIVPLSFANADEIRAALKEMVSNRGSIEVEKGNNAIIVTDIERNVEKVKSLIAELDRKLKQVEIVAKMVDVDFETTRELGVRWDLLNVNLSDLNGTAGAIIDARGPLPIGVFRFGTVQSWGELQLLLEALEKDKKANIISNPRIVTADNREASILVGKEIPLIVSDEAGNPITELTKIGITLRVTPHVNQDNSITLDLHPEVSELATEATVQGGVIITLSESDTRVVVNNGETAVIGGLINEVESSLREGIPVLKDVPILGPFFRFESKTKKKRELITFVTPTIVSDFASAE